MENEKNTFKVLRRLELNSQFIGYEISRLYREVLIGLLTYGVESSPREMKTVEILGAQVRLTDLRNNILATPERGLNFRFMVAEWLWIEAGREDVAFMAQYNKNITQFSDDGEIFNGAYGPRLAPQWNYIINSLKKSDTRQAVATIWTPSPSDSKDIPCTVAFQFLIREGKLHLIATMRSSDVWLGLPYDMFNFSQIANGIAGALGVDTGSLIMQLGSLHMYEKDWETAKTLINNVNSEYIRSPRLPDRAPAKGLVLHAETQNQEHKAYFKEPWSTYLKVLRSKTKAEAKEILNGETNTR